MRLKSLELVGFKSFLDATVISFAPGMTAVVGPNGAASPTSSTRSAGCSASRRRRVCAARAPRTLSTPATIPMPPPGWPRSRCCSKPRRAARCRSLTLRLSEVAVTRRVYRSGESEYLLNRIPCRLKDITEFFMAAQIHSRGYALIEQGRIEEIIQAKPHELRTMVEEAAGLSLFKGRREMSERKLERVKRKSRAGRRRAERNRAPAQFRPPPGQKGGSLQV